MLDKLSDPEFIASIVTAAVTICAVISAILPDAKDHKILGPIMKLVNKGAINVGKAKNDDKAQ